MIDTIKRMLGIAPKQISQNITWRPEHQTMEGTGFSHPKPAKEYIPQWYKDIPKIAHDHPTMNLMTGEYNHTVKACVPLIDAFSSGFIQELNADLLVSKNHTGESIINWPRQNFWEPVRPPRNPMAMNGFKHPQGFKPNPFLWVQPFEFGVPKGWSVLITHPLNRFDLPFQTMSAVVDSDDFPMRSEITFYLREDFVGTIPMGTPIFQVIPFQRADWHASLLPYSESHRLKYVNLTRNIFSGAYRARFWKKKNYLDVAEKCPVTGATHEGDGK
ncbi:hypothetical protein UFOVP1131_72 [uncultured Caudovirales phage]|uniref:Uncharacterized protein n=1 Tax=uncultured Caudovirales phage TaxID=2100421 RepID=A0A6J5RKW6_9CAUD|nr:hypothetical protein UFOVP966_86 [uncultured Caudovirales phage]CAB4184958.1 hypothetical protein UFOVP1131_72 [uncultured Caudovirales phage]CAB4192885.1 hypothetical protein UFOVP1245_114 [uncultured Caudovirales phage]CAB5231328.1 hypothetical protein UFOVP1582_64 [uncultured Caudovirales phage]